jgi:hypothetical protein
MRLTSRYDWYSMAAGRDYGVIVKEDGRIVGGLALERHRAQMRWDAAGLRDHQTTKEERS